ncbi:MAG TPA: PP2C family serine/threonine-protein phosphatase [Acidimicrobiia bacterium]|nr:PP2C family serine/threonine-protein phosphatase [Acidimicrobiia bacterium]
MKYQWSAGTHKGRVRNNNEDSFAPETSGAGTGPVVLMVADGMGGAIGGEIASQLAVEHASVGAGSPVERVIRANEAVVERTLNEPGLAGMGTTLTLAELGEEGTVQLAHVGDTRAYLLHHQGTFEQLTSDHTVVAEQLAAGHISPADAVTHPQRSMLTRVLGISPEIEVDSITFDSAPGDRLLICSDGLTNMVEDERIAQLLAKGSPEEAVWTLIEEANRAGGHDNITVVVVDVEQ